MPSIPDGLGIFNPAFPYNWSEDGLFNQTTDFLQHLQQCLHLYCESELLDWLITTLVGPASAWFDDQPKFTSLHGFGIALTNAFPSKPPTPPEQQELEASPEVPRKAAKQAERNAVKDAKRVKSKALKAEQAARPTPTVQDIGIFDPTLTCKDRRFSDPVEFLQHLQHCQHLYRESDLLILLPTCLGGAAFDIWYNKQDVMSSASLSEWIEALRAEFVIFAKSASTMTCMRCGQNFNTKETLREHVREQHAKKLVKSSCLDSNIAKLMCKDDEKPAVNDSSFASAPQEPDTSTATPKQIVDLTKTSEPVASLKDSRLPSSTPENVPEPVENTSTRCFVTPLESAPPQTFESEHQGTAIQKSAKDSHLSINAINLVCEIVERSSATHVSPAKPAKPQNSISEPAATFRPVTPLERSNLPLPTLETEPESAEGPATCRHCRQTFKFKELLREHRCEQHAKKPAISSPLRSHSPKPVCKAEEKSAVKDVTALSASQELHILAQKPQKIDSPKQSIVCSPLSNDTANSTCEAAERSAIILPAEDAEPTAEWLTAFRTQAARIRVRMEAERAALQVSALETASESMERPSIQQTARARICRRCKQSFNSNNKLHEHIRQHHARKPTKSSGLRVPTPEPTCKIKEKPAFTCPPAPLAPPTPSATPTSISESVSPKGSHLPITTLDITPKQAEIAAMLATRGFTPRRAEIAAFNCPLAPPPTLPATPRSQISSAEIASRPVSSSGSNLPIATHRTTPKSMDKLPANCSLTPPASPPRTSPRTPVPEHQTPYLTIDDLVRMFRGKSRPFGLRQHHNRRPSQQGSGIRQSRSVKPHLTIENLFEMFNGKSKRKGLFQSRNNIPSQASSGRMRITAYFKPTANQKPSIIQDSKSSKPKTLNQHMPAEWIRTAISKDLPERSANLPYKSADVSCVRNRPLQALGSSKSKPSKPRTPAETPSFIFILLRLLPAFLLALAIVSAVSAATMGCINVYGQAISAIGRAIQ